MFVENIFWIIIAPPKKTEIISEVKVMTSIIWDTRGVFVIDLLKNRMKQWLATVFSGPTYPTNTRKASPIKLLYFSTLGSFNPFVCYCTGKNIKNALKKHFSLSVLSHKSLPEQLLVPKYEIFLVGGNLQLTLKQFVKQRNIVWSWEKL